MKRNDYLLYIAFIIIGLLLSYNTNFLNIQEVKAEHVNTELPTIKFDPKGNFSLDIKAVYFIVINFQWKSWRSSSTLLTDLEKILYQYILL